MKTNRSWRHWHWQLGKVLSELCKPFRYLWWWFGEELLPIFLMVLESFLPQWCWLACHLLWLGGYRFTSWHLANRLHIFRLKWFFQLNRLQKTKSLTKTEWQRSNGVLTMLRTNSTIHCDIKAAGNCNCGCLVDNKMNCSLIYYSWCVAPDCSTCMSTFQIAVDCKLRSGSHWNGRWLFPAYNCLAVWRSAVQLLRFPRSATALC